MDVLTLDQFVTAIVGRLIRIWQPNVLHKSFIFIITTMTIIFVQSSERKITFLLIQAVGRLIRIGFVPGIIERRVDSKY
jgi:hypothetical protein